MTHRVKSRGKCGGPSGGQASGQAQGEPSLERELEFPSMEPEARSGGALIEWIPRDRQPPSREMGADLVPDSGIDLNGQILESAI